MAFRETVSKGDKLFEGHMVGYMKQSEEEVIYREYIAEMSDDRLEEEARDYIWLCETSLGGPWPIYTWKRNLVRIECERRGKPEPFERAFQIIMQDITARSGSHIS